MKIIYIENVRIPSDRAHAYQIVQNCAWFARHGHTVTLVNPARANGADVFEAFEIEKNLFQHVSLPVFDALILPFIPKKIGYALQRMSFFRAIRGWIRNQQADVWYTRDPAVVECIADGKRRIFLELHDASNIHHSRWESVKRSVTGYIVISSALRDALIKVGIDEKRIVISPDGYDPKTFATLPDRKMIRDAFHLPQDAFVACYMGNLYAWKGIDRIARLWHLTPENAHLLILGGSKQDIARFQECIDPSAKERVHLAGATPHQESMNALTACDLGLLPTSPDTDLGRLYTSPIKQFEYMAAGLPTLASEVPSSHEVLDFDTAMFYDASKDDAAVTAIEKVMADSPWRERAGKLAREHVRPYTWEGRVQAIENFIAALPHP